MMENERDITKIVAASLLAICIAFSIAALLS